MMVRRNKEVSNTKLSLSAIHRKVLIRIIELFRLRERMRKSIENLGGRKLTGGRIISMRSRRKYEMDRYPNEAILGKNKTVNRRIRGNNHKTAVKTAEFANVSDSKSKKVTKLKILNVTKNTANKDYERRGVISKGALLETELGIARVVSRPGQEGLVNAILIGK